jgi:carbamoyltransferase
VILDGRDPESISLPLEPSARPRDDGLDPWGPLFLAGIVNAPRFLLDDIPHHLQRLRGGITHDSLPPFEFVEHHLAHAASAYYVSGFPEAAILTLDGRGEKATTLFAVGRGRQIEPLEEVHYPHSLGLLYEHVTDYLGFLRSSDEYKVMALASVGSDQFVEPFRRLVELGEGGQYRVTFADLESEFGPRRRKGESLEQRHFDVAEALQRVLEETVLELARRLRERTGFERLCLAGGVALNCVMNSRLRDASRFRDIFVQPAAGDAGTALGAAYVIEAQHRPEVPLYRMTHAYLGPGFTDERIRETLVRAKLDFEEPEDISSAAAELLAEDRIIGWFQGRMEFGPRALGARSIVASPRDPAMKDRLNEIKDREDFRPVAPAVLEERAGEYFSPNTSSPYMLFIHDVKDERKHEIPAVCHFDGSARIQTVSKSESPIFHRLIEAFGELTGTPVVVNTSFNTLGQPIVCTPEDALECYFTSPLDALAIGSFLLIKSKSRGSAPAQQPAVAAWGLGEAR